MYLASFSAQDTVFDYETLAEYCIWKPCYQVINILLTNVCNNKHNTFFVSESSTIALQSSVREANKGMWVIVVEETHD